MKCANCLNAKVYIGKTSNNQDRHYVRCKKRHWLRKVAVYSPLLRTERECEDYISMSDREETQSQEDDFINNLPHTKLEYEVQYG